MKTYLIKLRPLDKFFFGTGKEFGTDNQNYFVKSGYFPQQSSLLGMLRYELLKNADKSIFENNKIQNPEKAKELIGEKSFVANAEDNSFGKIQSISPVFLMKGENKLFPQSKEYQKDDKDKIKFLEFEFEDNLPNLKDYNPKYGIEHLWSDKDENHFMYKDVFITQNQTGIRKQGKNSTKKDQNKAFYVQTFYKMKKDFYFAFYATLDNEVKLENSTVILGGERQLFEMKIEEVDVTDKELNYEYKSSSVDKIVLLSDAYIKEELNNICDFAITDIVNFRCLQANTSTEKYYTIRQKKAKKEDDEKDRIEYRKKNLHKSAELQLYTKGSVFYFHNQEKQQDFKDAINNSSFKTIGYNHYNEINKK